MTRNCVRQVHGTVKNHANESDVKTRFSSHSLPSKLASMFPRNFKRWCGRHRQVNPRTVCRGKYTWSLGWRLPHIVGFGELWDFGQPIQAFLNQTSVHGQDISHPPWYSWMNRIFDTPEGIMLVTITGKILKNEKQIPTFTAHSPCFSCDKHQTRTFVGRASYAAEPVRSCGDQRHSMKTKWSRTHNIQHYVTRRVHSTPRNSVCRS